MKISLPKMSLERLSKIIFSVEKVTEGKDLLALADHTRFDICFDNNLPDITQGIFDYPRQGKHAKIRLNPRFDDLTLICCLAHELRHMWQNTVVEYSTKNQLCPTLRLVFNRLIEGDAHAFERYFYLKHKKSNHAQSFSWHAAFMEFQTSDEADSYDRLQLDRIADLIDLYKEPETPKEAIPQLKSDFSVASFANLHVKDILRQGIEPTSPNYGTTELCQKIFELIRPSNLRQAQRLEARIQIL
jgi:hypothetical protein